MKIFWFCCQSNTQVGLGHLSRLVAIAEELHSKGHVTCFSHYSTIDVRGRNLLRAANFTISCVCESSFDTLVIDSYDLMFLNEIPVRFRSKVIQVVDDVSPYYMAAGYIQASPIKNWKPMNQKGKIFYFDSNPILRKKYDKIKRDIRSGGKYEVLISLGAVKNRVTIIENLILELNQYNNLITNVNILAEDSLESKLNLDFNELTLKWLKQTIDFPEIIPPVNYVISAAGVTAWEMIALGVPGFVIAASENQEQQLKYLLDNYLRNGIQYLDQRDFRVSIRDIFIKDFMLNFQGIPVSLKNGRVEVSSWLDKF